MNRKPFRWTKRNITIRDALNANMTKRDILFMVEKNGASMRPSELAMTVADWVTAIDEVTKRIKDS